MDLESLIIQTLGDKYEIQSVIGKGGMATVYKAIQKSLNRPVAIKVIHQNLVHDEELVKRFIREAQVCASLDHSNIVTVYDVGSIGTIHFMSMEYLEGLTLRDLIKIKGNLSVEETSNNIIPIADAIDYIHREGIIHRDVKSSNIFITKKGRVVLMDFGIVYSEGRESLSQYGTVLGTPEYMSPEQAEGNVKIDGRSDIYSLGVILFECLTGRLPFHSDNYISTLHHVLHETPPTVTSVNPQLPKWISSIVSACLVKDRNLRIKSGSSLSTALRSKQIIKTIYQVDEYGTQKMESNKIQTEYTKPTNSTSTAKKKKSWILASLLAVICILLIVIIYLESIPSGNVGKLGSSQSINKQNISNQTSGGKTLRNQGHTKITNVDSASNQDFDSTNRKDENLSKVLELVEQGDQDMEKGDPARAREKYKQALKLAPTNNNILDKIVAANNVVINKTKPVKIESENNILKDIDGNKYKTVIIGRQVWMAENLKTTKYNNGTAIPNVTDYTEWIALTSPAYCWYNNDAATNKITYGALYNWNTVNPTSNGRKNVCPTGWHIPTDAEWTTLTTYLGGVNVAGGKLKETGTTHWDAPNTGANNETAFTALPGGSRSDDGTFSNIGYGGNWLSSAEGSTTYAWDRGMSCSSTDVSRGSGHWQGGFSIRCVRDY